MPARVGSSAAGFCNSGMHFVESPIRSVNVMPASDPSPTPSGSTTLQRSIKSFIAMVLPFFAVSIVPMTKAVKSFAIEIFTT